MISVVLEITLRRREMLFQWTYISKHSGIAESGSHVWNCQSACQYTYTELVTSVTMAVASVAQSIKTRVQFSEALFLHFYNWFQLVHDSLKALELYFPWLILVGSQKLFALVKIFTIDFLQYVIVSLRQT